MRLMPDDRADEEMSILARLKAGERFEQYETVRVAKDRRKIDVSVTISPIFSADGEIVAASKVVRDISQRKRTEAQLSESEDVLNASRNSPGCARASMATRWTSALVDRLKTCGSSSGRQC